MTDTSKAAAVLVKRTCAACKKDFEGCVCANGPFEVIDGELMPVASHDLRKLGPFVRHTRKAMHLTLGEAARRLGKRWTLDRLSALETGRAMGRVLTEEDFEQLAFVLNVDVDTLIDKSGLCPHCLGSGIDPNGNDGLGEDA